MPRANYKGLIFFPEGYNKSLAEFKEEFGSTHVFKNIHPKDREKELKAAHKIATSGNGNTSGTATESKGDNTGEAK